MNWMCFTQQLGSSSSWRLAHSLFVRIHRSTRAALSDSVSNQPQDFVWAVFRLLIVTCLLTLLLFMPHVFEYLLSKSPTHCAAYLVDYRYSLRDHYVCSSTLMCSMVQYRLTALSWNALCWKVLNRHCCEVSFFITVDQWGPQCLLEITSVRFCIECLAMLIHFLP